MIDNSKAKNILDFLAKRCGYDCVSLKYGNGAMKWNAYVCKEKCCLNLIVQKGSLHRYLSVIGSSRSYAECMKNMLEATSNGYDILVDDFYEERELFLKNGMTEEMILIEMNLECAQTL